MCCSKHRAFIQTYNSNNDFIGSPVINEDGIIGQIIYGDSLSEVLLLTDIDHVLPIVSGNHFCNAKGSGKPGIIICKYNNKFGKKKYQLDKNSFHLEWEAFIQKAY